MGGSRDNSAIHNAGNRQRERSLAAIPIQGLWRLSEIVPGEAVKPCGPGLCESRCKWNQAPPFDMTQNKRNNFYPFQVNLEVCVIQFNPGYNICEITPPPQLN